MKTVFVTIFNMSVTATFVALLLLSIRHVFSKKLPTTYCYLLWSTLLFRLIVTYAPISKISLFNMLPSYQDIEPYNPSVIVQVMPSTTGQALQEGSLIHSANLQIFAVIWIVVVVAMLLYGTITYAIASIQLRNITLLHLDTVLNHCKDITKTQERNIHVYQGNLFGSPAVVGVFHPKIILPSDFDLMDEEQLCHVLTHELVHIKRFDYITKMLATISLCIHWFNPMIWLCYHLYGVDIEISCDEYTLKSLGHGHKKSMHDR